MNAAQTIAAMDGAAHALAALALPETTPENMVEHLNALVEVLNAQGITQLEPATEATAAETVNAVRAAVLDIAQRALEALERAET